MSEITKISKDLIIFDDILDAHDGQLDGIARIGNPTTNQVYGYIQYSLYQKTFNVQMIEVYKEFQRKGYATILTNYIKKAYKGYKINNGYTTEEGNKLFQSIKRKKVK